MASPKLSFKIKLYQLLVSLLSSFQLYIYILAIIYTVRPLIYSFIFSSKSLVVKLKYKRLHIPKNIVSKFLHLWPARLLVSAAQNLWTSTWIWTRIFNFYRSKAKPSFVFFSGYLVFPSSKLIKYQIKYQIKYLFEFLDIFLTINEIIILKNILLMLYYTLSHTFWLCK